MLGASGLFAPVLPGQHNRVASVVRRVTQDVRAEFAASDDSGLLIRINGLSRESLEAIHHDKLQELIAVYTRRGEDVSETPLFGEIRVKEGQLQFIPRFPFRPGMQYRIQLHDDLGGTVWDLSLPAENRPQPNTEVVDVYPTQATLPENLLKFYVQFSQPMSRGEVYQRTRILDANGRVVELAFLEINEELWDPNHTRVTLLFDPGRIKRELRPREEIGSPLREGKAYTLVVDKSWKDAKGNELTGEFRKDFRVGSHDESCPDPLHWEMEVPMPETKGPLVVRFDEALDRAMLEHDLTVIDANSERVSGAIKVLEHETVWQFVPDETWKSSQYKLRVATRLEDLAGNSISKPFEVDLTQPFESKYPDKFFFRTFQPGDRK